MKVKGKGKGKVHPIKGHEGTELEYRCSSTLSLTSALDGVGSQRYAPGALPPRKTQYPLYRRLGGPHTRSGQVQKISPTSGFDPPTVQPVASRYTDWAIPAHLRFMKPYIWIACNYLLETSFFGVCAATVSRIVCFCASCSARIKISTRVYVLRNRSEDNVQCTYQSAVSCLLLLYELGKGKWKYSHTTKKKSES